MTRPFRFAVQSRSLGDHDQLVAEARRVEALGYDELFSFDHIGTVDPFVPLIVVNCIILGRAEAFAGKVAPMRAVADGIGMGVGFTLVLSAMSSFRELLGSGSLLGFNILGPKFEPWVFMVMPPGGFLTLGIMFLIMGWYMARTARRAKEVTA